MNEHNPITQRLDEMVAIWKKDVKPQHRLVRWMLNPEDHRMYEGFCRLEATAHGKLDSLFIFFYTPFSSAGTFSLDIIENWLREYDENEKLREQLKKHAVKEDWDIEPYRLAVEQSDYENGDRLLAQMTASYRRWLHLQGTPCVLALLPKQISSKHSFNTWIKQWAKEAREPMMQLCVFDHAGQNHWGKAFAEYTDISCSLHHDLRMKEAVQQIATAGAATDPHAAFRQCMFEMGKASSKKNASGVEEWGEKAIQIGKKSGDRMLLATAYLTYAGMLFMFDRHHKTAQLLNDGMRLCQSVVASGDESMKPLLLQFFQYKGAHAQIIGLRAEAHRWFMKSGDEAAAFGFYSQALSSYYKTYIFAENANEAGQMEQAVLASMRIGPKLSDNDVISGEYPFLAYAFLMKGRGDENLRQQTEHRMVSNFGTDWPLKVEGLKENYTKNKIRQAQAQSVVEM